MKRTKKPKGPKEVHYELILRDSLIGASMYELLDRLLAEHHGDRDLGEVRIALAWCTSWKPDVDGRVTLGRCRKATDLDRELFPYDFVILLSKDFWQNLRVSDAQRAALLDHEIMHAAVKYDDKGEPVIDERGRTVYRTRRHDLEEFVDIVRRYGCYKADLEYFATALDAVRARSGEWIGYSHVQQQLANAGATVSMEAILRWSDAERREAEVWAVVQQDLQKRDAMLSAVCPDHVTAAQAAPIEVHV